MTAGHNGLGWELCRLHTLCCAVVLNRLSVCEHSWTTFCQRGAYRTWSELDVWLKDNGWTP